MVGIEPADVLASEFLHEFGHVAGFRGCDQQMDVVVHQYIGMQSALGRKQCFVKQGPVALTVDVVEKAGQAVVAALNNMLRDVREIESGLSSHAPTMLSGNLSRLSSPIAPSRSPARRSTVRGSE